MDCARKICVPIVGINKDKFYKISGILFLLKFVNNIIFVRVLKKIRNYFLIIYFECKIPPGYVIQSISKVNVQFYSVPTKSRNNRIEDFLAIMERHMLGNSYT